MEYFSFYNDINFINPVVIMHPITKKDYADESFRKESLGSPSKQADRTLLKSKSTLFTD
jgi:hypothetical protein